MCRLWEKDRSIWPYYYGSNYDPYQRGRLRKEVQKKEYEIIFEDKNICYNMCKAGNLPLPKQFGCIEPHIDYRVFIRNILINNLADKIIIKPILGKGGKNIYLAFRDDENIIIKGKYSVCLLEQFSLKYISVVQEYTRQHQLLDVFSKSTNTIRIATLLTKDNGVLILGAFMRFGLDDSFLDNMSSGGVGVGIDIDKGVLNEFSSDDMSRKLAFHPTSKKAYKDFQLPYWQDVVDLAKKTQKYFSFYKLLGHDILITPNGPIIIEINAIHDNVGIEQTYGPILADPRVLYEFKRYGLLINNLSYPKS
jgi:glutathione synthase/RimK-type ligase-like ATP-grasp enzyme